MRRVPKALVSPGDAVSLITDPRGPWVRWSMLETGMAMMRAYELGDGIVRCAIFRSVQER